VLVKWGRVYFLSVLVLVFLLLGYGFLAWVCFVCIIYGGKSD
jgi:hypothetical protein